MSIITRLNVSSIRNLQKVELDPSNRVNLIYGANGSGKTSILESIHLLATGKSFRSTRIDPVIQNGAESSVVFVELDGSVNIGLHKSRNKQQVLKLLGSKQSNWAEVARLLPVLVLDSNTFMLLEGSPKIRRSFLDWGVFHVEPSYIDFWRDSRKCLANRNLLLKQNYPDIDQLTAWDVELCRSAQEVDSARKRYFEQFVPVFKEVHGKLSDMQELSLTYYRGWDHGKSLSDLLIEGRPTDHKYGATQNGPHRADIRVKIGKLNAVDILSRGQQKLLVGALKIAQGILLSRAVGKNCIFLVDDLPAELDVINRAAILYALDDLGGQLFITSVDENSMENCWRKDTIVAKFHVEHGIITS